MSDSPLDRMIFGSVKCVVCGAKYGECDCWQKCPKCGWSFRKGEQCDSPKCTGVERPHRVMAMTGRRKRGRKP